MNQNKQGCDRSNCQFNENGACTLSAPQVVKRDAFVDCYSFKNKTESSK